MLDDDDDAGARTAVQPVGDDVRAAVVDGIGARADLHADVRDAVRRTSDARHRARRSRPAQHRRPRDARNARRRHSGQCRRRRLDADRQSRRVTASRSASRDALARMLGLEARDIDSRGEPLWVDTGSEQLVIPLASFDAVRRAKPQAADAAAARQQRRTRDGVHVRARGQRRARAVLLPEARRRHRGPGHGIGVRQSRRLVARH